MNTKLKTILGILIFIAFLSVAYFAYTSLSDDYKLDDEKEANTVIEDESSNLEGMINPAPDFTVFNLDGGEVKLSDFIGEKPIVLNFWASWCPPCKTEMPYFNEVYAELGEEIEFVMVDVVDGKRETKEKGQKYVEDEGFDFPVYFDISEEAANAYNITYIPTTILISKEGNIVSKYQGTIDKDTLLSGIVLLQ